MPNGGMNFGFMGPMPNANMYNPYPYQNNNIENKVYELEKRVENLEKDVKDLNQSVQKGPTYNYNYDYKTSMNMM